MFGYRANPLHSVGFLVLGVLFGIIGTYIPKGFGWLYAAGGICFLISLFVSFWVFWEYEIKRWDSIGIAADKINKMDDHRFQVLGMSFPKLRGRWSNGLKPVLAYSDCQTATLDHLAIFINGSDNKQVFPVRYWTGTKEFRGRKVILTSAVYKEILDDLISRGMVRKDSAVGSHSWLWMTPETYANIRTFWADWIYEEVQEI